MDSNPVDSFYILMWSKKSPSGTHRTMENKNIWAQIYGYAICLTAVITFLICITDLVDALVDKSDPLNAGRASTALDSFENYKIMILKDIKKESTYIPDDQAIQKMYESARENRIKKVKHDVRKSLTSDILLIAISLVLFGVHWTWLQRMRRKLS
ncbi:hypothetical protein ACFLSA_05350 [Bacteroidota bacterium]